MVDDPKKKHEDTNEDMTDMGETGEKGGKATSDYDQPEMDMEDYEREE